MKFIRLATIAALSTTILAGGSQAFAEEELNGQVRSYDSEANVSFSATDENDEGEDTEVINPEEEGPDVTIPPITGPEGNKGPLTIAYAPNMDFGTQIISNQDRTYNMVAEMQPLDDGSDYVPYTSFVQVQDTRGTNAGWDVQVSLSNFTADTQNGVLTGAEIVLVSPRLQYEGANKDNAPTIHNDGLRLIPESGAVSVMTADSTKGAGTSSVVWGDQATLDAQYEDEEIEDYRNEGIQLFVPGSTAKDAVTYNSTISWELTSVVDADGANN